MTQQTTLLSISRSLVVVLCFVAAVLSAPSASSAQQPNLNRPYEPWQESYESALELSRTTGRPIMLVFTGSDWCKACEQLTENVFLTHEFAAWSTKNVIKVEVDFPNGYRLPDQLRTQNFNLRSKFGRHIKSFPTALFINSDETVIGKVGFQNNVQQWIEAANAVVRPPSDDLVAMNVDKDSLGNRSA